MLVPGSLDLLNALEQKGVKMYLASGTDEGYVREEAALLEIDSYFGENIYGAIDDYRSFSKAQVIRNILNNEDVVPSKLVGFGRRVRRNLERERSRGYSSRCRKRRSRAQRQTR